MEKKIWDAPSLQKNIPPAEEGFEAQTMALLRRQAAADGLRPARRMKWSMALALGLACILLLATALALGLQWSARTRAMKTAREAVMSQYGLTLDTLTLFEEIATEQGGAWAVRFTPIFFDLEATGEYTVTIESGKAPEARWTHDGAPASGMESGRFDIPVWGQPQLENILAIRQLQRKGSAEGELALPVLEGEPLAMAQALGLDPDIMHPTPTENDLSQEEAVQLAREALAERYGLPMERIPQEVTYSSFLKYADDDEPVYRIELNGSEEGFWVPVFSPSGKIGKTHWWIAPELRTLPEGPLDAYEYAVREFVEEGSFHALPAGEKMDIAARIREAGYGDLLDSSDYLTPASTDLSQEAAAAAVTAAMKARGFTDDTLALFTVSLSLQSVENQRAWVAEYAPDTALVSRSDLREMITDRLGHYRVELAAETGETRSFHWDLQEQAQGHAYTRQNWGQAAAYDVATLSWLQEILQARRAFVEQEQETGIPLTLEENAASDQLFRDVGFNSRLYSNGVPGAGDLPLEKAWELAKQAIQNEYGISLQEVDSWPRSEYFTVEDPAAPQWYFWIFATGDRQGEDLSVVLDAKTGTILLVIHSAGGNG